MNKTSGNSGGMSGSGGCPWLPCVSQQRLRHQLGCLKSGAAQMRSQDPEPCCTRRGQSTAVPQFSNGLADPGIFDGWE